MLYFLYLCDTMRYSITLSYDGSSFCGWQLQRGDPSVQGCLEEALSTLLGTTVAVTGAGRTDSKVNAVGYIAHFDIVDVGAPDPAELAYKLNAILPPSVVIHAISPEAPDFHARFDASQRKYTYFLHRLKDPFVEKYSLRRDWDLDFAAMNRAAALLTGRHDFACFEKKGTDVKTTVCTVREAFWAPYVPTHVALMGFGPSAPASVSEATDPREAGKSPGGESFPQDGSSPDWRYAYFRISADRFLRNMVRAVVGTLLEVGRGKRSLEDFASLILEAPEEPLPADALRIVRNDVPELNLRGRAGDSVPGHALFFSGVEYDGRD